MLRDVCCALAWWRMIGRELTLSARRAMADSQGEGELKIIDRIQSGRACARTMDNHGAPQPLVANMRAAPALLIFGFCAREILVAALISACFCVWSSHSGGRLGPDADGHAVVDAQHLRGQ